MDREPNTWACDPWCPTCQHAVEVQVTVNVGIAEYLEGNPACPECHQPGLRLSQDVEAPMPVARTQG